MNRWSMFGVLVAGSGLVACGGADGKVEEGKTGKATGTLAVQGHVSSKVALDKARAVAIAKDGRTFWTYLDANRDFTLKLPVGHAYRIVIANQRPEGKGQVVTAKLALESKNGKSNWLGANQQGVVDLGSLRPGTTAGSVGPRCMGCSDADDDDDDDGDADHSDDNDCHESSPPSPGGGSSADAGTAPNPSDADDDDDDDCDVCSSGSEGEVTPSKPPGSMCDADDDDDDDADSDKACH